MPCMANFQELIFCKSLQSYLKDACMELEPEEISKNGLHIQNKHINIAYMYNFSAPYLKE